MLWQDGTREQSQGLGIWEWGRCRKDGGTEPCGHGREQRAWQREQQVQSLGSGNVPYVLRAPEEISKGLPRSVAVWGHVPLLPHPARL